MHSSVSVQEKKLFLEWVLSQFNFEENGWLLEEIAQDDRKLEMIHFVESIQDCPKGIQLSFQQEQGMQFLFFKGSIKTRDVYTAFHELQLHEKEAYYIAIDFPDKQANVLYQSVTEADAVAQTEMAQFAEDLLDYLTIKQHITFLEKEINKALDSEDMTGFHYYAKELKKWKSL